jgi:hypothetical protein
VEPPHGLFELLAGWNVTWIASSSPDCDLRRAAFEIELKIVLVQFHAEMGKVETLDGTGMNADELICRF